MPVTVKVNGAANSLVHKGSNGISIATIPDVCKTPSPGGPIPIPYPNISQSATLAKGTTTVKADGGMMIAVKGSEFSLSNGDNPGVAGGVKSSTFMKESTWILYSFDVKMDGSNACRLTDKKFQNHENTADLGGALQAPVPMGPAAAAATAAPNCNPSKVELQVDKTVLTLKHDCEAKISVLIEPSDVVVDACRIEIKRASGGSWCILAKNQVLDPWRFRIAGKFKARGVATVCGKEHLTPEKDVEVRFPSYSDITGDSSVKSALDAAWAATKGDCTEKPVNRRRELAFWIRLDTKTNWYVIDATVYGSWAGPGDGASATVSARPDDNPKDPDACEKGAVYPVAMFHTHTSTEFRAAAVPKGSVREVGPSSADNRFHSGQNVAGIVYDYLAPTGKAIPMGHPTGSAATLYQSMGVDRRPTP